MASETERNGDVQVTEVERATLQRLANGDRIVFSQDGDEAWFTNGDRAHLGDEVMTLRDKGFLLRKCDDEENYRGMSEYDTISDAGRAALTATQQPPATHKVEGEAVALEVLGYLIFEPGDAPADFQPRDITYAEEQAGWTSIALTDRDKAAETVERLTRENASLRGCQKDMVAQISRLATEAGEAKGKLEGSEMAGVVDGWKSRATRAEAALAEAEKALEPFRNYVDVDRALATIRDTREAGNG